ncbi:hypothetical protein [Siminovitchia terrae]|uniref:hypothetical protein n=1 Tax=Siminovitchia terrae TaxID=1914933 RepID=UPI0028A7F4C1|nr:hypothetical protein [Siminovitchia terrae]
MLIEPGKRNNHLNQQRKTLVLMGHDGHSTFLVAENMDKELVGYQAAFGSNARRTKQLI